MRMLMVAIVAWASIARADDLTSVIEKQSADPSARELYTDDVVLVDRPGENISRPVLGGPGELVDEMAPPSTTFTSEARKDSQIVTSTDGKSAWASFTVRMGVEGAPQQYRVSDLLVKTPKGWRIAATAWSVPVANATVNKQAKAGQRSIDEMEAPPADKALAAAFAKLAADGLDATAAARKDLVAFGSGPGERTVGGALLAKAWKAAWQGKVTIKSLTARVAPSGTTGWLAATVELDKKTYKVPFVVFCVFDRTAKGEWTLVHIHFAV